jgi:hypothetical protein
LSDSRKWNHVASSFEWLQGIGSASALKILPQIKQTPAKLVARYKRQTDRLTQTDGNIEAKDRAYLVATMMAAVVAMVLVSFAGVIALHLKLTVSFLDKDSSPFALKSTM